MDQDDGIGENSEQNATHDEYVESVLDLMVPGYDDSFFESLMPDILDPLLSDTVAGILTRAEEISIYGSGYANTTAVASAKIGVGAGAGISASIGFVAGVNVNAGVSEKELIGVIDGFTLDIFA